MYSWSPYATKTCTLQEMKVKTLGEYAHTQSIISLVIDCKYELANKNESYRRRLGSSKRKLMKAYL